MKLVKLLKKAEDCGSREEAKAILRAYKKKTYKLHEKRAKKSWFADNWG